LTDDFEDSVARIRAVGENIRRLLGEPEPNKTPQDLTLLGLTLEEAKDWIQNEPNFKKQIVSSLGHQTDGNTRRRTPERYQRRLPLCF
jgi:hypothetical protein